MPRPRCCRKISGRPPCALYAPGGRPAAAENAVILTLDEFEALRLADFEGLYHEKAAARMTVSRQTFGRIIESARRKTAQALVEARTLRIEADTGATKKDRRSRLCDQCPKRRAFDAGSGWAEGCPRLAARGEAIPPPAARPGRRSSSTRLSRNSNSLLKGGRHG
jgi:predicted DNA-binding protein (UPF0251 family)